MLELATSAEQREAHSALADALPAGDRARTWHLAESTVGPDSTVADELARLADADRHRLGYAAASAALERASALTEDPGLAAHRLAGAAHDAFVAGDVARVRSLVARVLAEDAPEHARGEALSTLGMLEQYAGSVPRSVEHLDDAARLLEGPPLVRVLTELALARFRLNDVAGMVDCAQRIDAVADPTDPEQRLLAAFTGGTALVLTGDPSCGSRQAGRRTTDGGPPVVAARRPGAAADGALGRLHRPGARRRGRGHPPGRGAAASRGRRRPRAVAGRPGRRPGVVG